jgi:SAM-dependent methyltransferase
MNNIKGIKEFYDDTVEIWADDWYENLTMLPFLVKVKETLPKGAKVLDLGCNCGYETRRMKELGLNPVGLDFSEKSIKLAKEKNLDIKFVCDDMLNDLSYLGNFDGVVAIASIIHIPIEKLELCFKRIYDILTDDGYLFIVVRAEEGKLEASYKEINEIKYDREVYGYSKKVLEDKMNVLFSFASEYPAHDEHWKYYSYKKNIKN